MPLEQNSAHTIQAKTLLYSFYWKGVYCVTKRNVQTLFPLTKNNWSVSTLPLTPTLAAESGSTLIQTVWQKSDGSLDWSLWNSPDAMLWNTLQQLFASFRPSLPYGRRAVCRDKATTRWEEVSIIPQNNTISQALQAQREITLLKMGISTKKLHTDYD